MDYKDPEKLTETMKGALAQMYANEDFRDYLEHLLSVYNANILVSIRGNQPDLAKDFTAKFDTIKKLLENGKTIFTRTETVRSKTLQEQLEKHD